MSVAREAPEHEALKHGDDVAPREPVVKVGHVVLPCPRHGGVVPYVVAGQFVRATRMLLAEELLDVVVVDGPGRHEREVHAARTRAVSSCVYTMGVTASIVGWFRTQRI